jgi:GntR family transcriptional regulator
MRHRRPSARRWRTSWRGEFTERYVEPLLTEATRLGIDSDELIALIKESSNEREGASL